MSSEFEKLVEAVTDLVVGELAGRKPDSPAPSPSAPDGKPGSSKEGGAGRVLVAPGPGSVEEAYWATLAGAKSVRPSVAVWTGFRQDELPAPAAGWSLEARSRNWSRVLSGYKGLVLLGADLTVLGSLANLGCGGCAPAAVGVSAIASGLPVFVDDRNLENVRRHSARLASGFVRRFEELHRMVASFGVEFGGPGKLADFLGRLKGPAESAAGTAARSGGRAVVTTEDVEAVRRAGENRLRVALGTIVTPLAAQRASEWGIEVDFQ